MPVFTFVSGALVITGIIVCIVHFAAKASKEGVGNKLGLCKPFGSFVVDEEANEKYKDILSNGNQAEKEMYRREYVVGDNLGENKYQKLWLLKKYNPMDYRSMQIEFTTAYILETLKNKGVIIGMVPKYRFLKQGKDEIVILTEFIENSTTLASKAKKDILEMGKERCEYSDYHKQVINYTERSDSFKGVLPVLLLLGDQDLHGNNFLISEDEEQIIPIDFGLSLREGINLYELLHQRKFLRKEMLLDDNFLLQLKETAESFLSGGRTHQIITDAVKTSTKVINKMCKNTGISKEEIAYTLNYNANQMLELYWHLQAEKAISSDNVELLKNALDNLHKIFPIVSQQNYRDGLVGPTSNFIEFIFSRKIKDSDLFRDECLADIPIKRITDPNYGEEIEDYFYRKDRLQKHGAANRIHLATERIYRDVLYEIGDDIGAEMLGVVEKWKQGMLAK